MTRLTPTIFAATLCLLTVPTANAQTLGTQTAVTTTRPGENASVPPTLPANPGPVAPTVPVVVPDNYRLDTGDLLIIEVMRHADVTRTVRLLADAKIRLPRLTSPIDARGKTVAELTEELVAKLTKEGKLRLRPGQVNVAVAEMRVRRVYVRGNAGRNAEYALQNDWRVSELYTVMGGVSDPERTTVTLSNPLRPEPIKINLLSAITDPTSPNNVPLQENDTLTIELPRRKRFFVKGEGPRGQVELDERFGLRQALVQLGFATSNASGDLRNAVLIRHTVPGDPTSPETRTKVDLYALLTDENAPEIPLQDMDTLDIPVSQRFVYIYGEIASPRKFYLREDQPTFLIDIMSLGGTTARAKIDDVKVWRRDEKTGKPIVKSYKFGKFLANGDAKQNPEIRPQDIIFVPDVKRPDVVNSIWQGWGLFGIVQAIIPGARLR